MTELTIFHSLLTNHLPAPEDSTSAGPVGDLSFVSVVLREHHILPSIFRDAENGYSESQKKSQELRDRLIKKATALVNIKSTDPSQRASGLYLLGLIITNATYEMLHKSYEQWCNSLLTILGAKSASQPQTTTASALLTLAELICTAQSWPDIKREVMKEAVFGNFMIAMLRCVEDPVLAQNVRKFCKIWQRDVVWSDTAFYEQHSVLLSLQRVLANVHNNNRIRTSYPRLSAALFKFLDFEQSQLGADAVACLSMLPDTNKSWVDLVSQIIDATHLVLHQIYVGFYEDKVFDDVGVLQEGEAPSVLRSTWQLTNVDDQHHRTTPAIASRRIERLVGVLKAAIGRTFAFAIDVPIGQLLDVIDHLLLLDGSVLKSKSLVQGLEPSEVAHLIGVLHRTGYSLLRQLFAALRTSMLQYGGAISSMLVEELNRVRNTSCLALHSDLTRVELYKTVGHALQLFGAGAVTISIAAVNNILADIKVPVLTQLITHDAPDSAKKRSRDGVSANTLSPTSVASESHVSDVVRSAAAEALEKVLLRTGAFLPADVRVKVDKQLVVLHVTMNRHHNQSFYGRTQFVPPFSATEYRLALYKSLVASCLSCSRTQAPIMTYAVQFLSTGLSDPALSVSEYCSYGAIVCEPIIHPRVPLVAPPIPEDRLHNPLGRLTNMLADMAVEEHESNKSRQSRIKRAKAREEEFGVADSMDVGPTHSTVFSQQSQQAPQLTPSFSMAPPVQQATVVAAPAPHANAETVTMSFTAPPAPAPASTPATFMSSAPAVAQVAGDYELDIIADGPDSDVDMDDGAMSD